MNSLQVQEAVTALWGTSSEAICLPISNGLINYSFCLERPGNKKIFLQQINKEVFTRPDLIAKNLQTIYHALQKKEKGHLMARPLSFLNGSWLFCDSNGQYWRAAEHIDARTLHESTTTQQLQAAVKGYANFTAMLADLDPALLHPTLVDFHDLSLRYAQFQEAIGSGDPDRIDETSAVIEAMVKREHYVSLFSQLRDSPSDFKKRIMHHDAKLSNLLFDLQGDEVVAITDLDTTMPGFFFSDLGDMVRTMAASAEENSSEPTKVTIRPSAYAMIYESYCHTLSEQWTLAEKSLLHGAGVLMIYMQTLRFLTDYLLGDRYYQIKRPGHNRDRALHQYTLLCSLEALLKNQYKFSLR